jgi:hypothetical protein
VGQLVQQTALGAAFVVTVEEVVDEREGLAAGHRMTGPMSCSVPGFVLAVPVLDLVRPAGASMMGRVVPDPVREAQALRQQQGQQRQHRDDATTPAQAGPMAGQWVRRVRHGLEPA